MIRISPNTFLTSGLSLTLWYATLSVAHAQAPPAPSPAPPTSTVPKGTRTEGPQFPRNELPEPKQTAGVAPPSPGRFDVSQLPQPLTLADAVAFALRLQPSVAGAQATREQSEQRLKASESAYYPRLVPVYSFQNRFSSGGSTTQLVNGIPVTVSRSNTSEFKQLDATASYTVFDSFNRELSAKQARQSLRSSKYNEEDTRQQVIANVASNYFNTLRTAALVTVAQSQVARAQNTLAVVTAQVEAGVSAQKDTYQAQADLLNAQVSFLQAQNNAAIAQAQLKQSIGLVGGDALTLADVPAPSDATPVTALGAPLPPVTLPTTQPNEAAGGALPQTSAPNSGVVSTAGPGSTRADVSTVNQLADTALKTRPDIARSQQDVAVAQTSVGLARINNGLQANVSVSDGYLLSPQGGGIFGLTNDWTDTQNRQLNLTLSYPLFDGFLTRSQVRQAQAQVRGTEANLLSLRQNVSVEVEQGFRTLTQARAAIPAAQAAQAAAQVNYDAAVESRREGVGSIVEIIQAQASLVQAQVNLVQAIYDFYTADAALARAVGSADKIATISEVAKASNPGAPGANETVNPGPGTRGSGQANPGQGTGQPNQQTTPAPVPNPANPGTARVTEGSHANG